MRGTSLLSVVGGLAVLIAASCGSSGVCAPGQQVACPCPGGLQGAQACNSDGKGYAACQCPGGTSSSSSTGTGTGGMGTTLSTSVGTTTSSSSGGGTGGMATTSSSSSSSTSSTSSGGPTCAPTWSKGFPASNSATVSQVAVDAAGDVIMAGTLLGTADFGTGPLMAAGNWSSAVVAKYDCTGKPLWSKVFGMPFMNSDVFSSVAVDPAGAILLTGGFSDSLDFGCGALVGQGSDGFITKLDASGNCVWSKRFGGAQNADYGSGIAADAAGNVFVTGTFNGTTNFGGGPITSSNGTALFALKLDPAGNHVWSKQFGQPQNTAKIALDAAGNIFLCGGSGNTIGNLDFGGGPLPAANGLYLAKLDPNGGFIWNKGIYNNGGSATCNGAATDPNGNLVVGGTYANTLDFGGGALPNAQGNQGGFIAEVTTGGTHVFSMGNAGNSDTRVVSVAADAAGNVLFTGIFDTTVAFGGPTLTSAGNQDVFVVKLSPTGAFGWSKRFGDASQQSGNGIAISPVGAPVVGGFYVGTIDFGNGPLPMTPNGGAFLARL